MPAWMRRVQPGPGRLRAALSICSSALLGGVAVGDEIADPLGKAAPAPALRFRSAQPAAQFGGFERRQMAGKGGVGGIEKMMAFIEDETAQSPPGAASSSSVVATPSA